MSDKKTLPLPTQQNNVLAQQRHGSNSLSARDIYSAVTRRDSQISLGVVLHGVNPDLWNREDEENLLHLFAMGGYVAEGKLLLELGAVVDLRDGNEYSTALLLAAGFGNLGFVKLLLAHAADIQARDRKGWTALHYAADHGHTEVALVLLENGVDINARDRNNKTALQIVTESGCRAFDDLRSTDGKDNDQHTGTTPDFLNVIELLLLHDADVNSRDSLNRTALDVATAQGCPEIVALLQPKSV